MNKEIRSSLQVETLHVDVIQRPVKNMRLLVNIHDKTIRIIAPLRLSLELIKSFAMKKYEWICKQLSKIEIIKAKTKYTYITGEEHVFLGKLYILEISETNKKPQIKIDENIITMYVAHNAAIEKRKALLESYYREELKKIIARLIAKWEPIMNVRVKEFGVKKMKTRWGTCNPRAQRIWLTFGLIHGSMECIEYVVIHEMAHLLERRHGKKFIALMDRYLPDWRGYKKILGRMKLGAVD